MLPPENSVHNCTNFVKQYIIILNYSKQDLLTQNIKFESFIFHCSYSEEEDEVHE